MFLTIFAARGVAAVDFIGIFAIVKSFVVYASSNCALWVGSSIIAYNVLVLHCFQRRHKKKNYSATSIKKKRHNSK